MTNISLRLVKFALSSGHYIHEKQCVEKMSRVFPQEISPRTVALPVRSSYEDSYEDSSYEDSSYEETNPEQRKKSSYVKP